MFFTPRRRRSDWLHDDDDPLRKLAAELVTRALDRRWGAMVRTSVLVAFLVALLVDVPLTLIQNDATDRAAVARAAHSCHLITKVARVMGNGDPNDPRIRQGGFISSDAGLREAEAARARQIRGSGPLAKLIADPDTIRLERANAITESVTLNYWRRALIPALLDAAHADCASQ